MKRIATLAIAACLVAATPAKAGGGHHDHAGAIIGGFAAGALLGGLASNYYGYGYGYRGPYWGPPPPPPPPLHRPPPVVYGGYGYAPVYSGARHRCHDVRQDVWIDGRRQLVYNRACLQSDGTWRIVD